MNASGQIKDKNFWEMSRRFNDLLDAVVPVVEKNRQSLMIEDFQ